MNRQAEDIALALNMYGLIASEKMVAAVRIIRNELLAGSPEYESDDERSRRITDKLALGKIEYLTLVPDAEE